MKKAILVVSFGTTYKEAMENSIDATVNHISNEFKDYDIFQAYTSNIIRRKLIDKGMDVNDTKTALEIIKNNGYEKVIILSLHMIAGYEYEKILEAVEAYKNDFREITATTPMLYEEKDYKQVAEIIKKIYSKTNTPIVMMGHGSEHENDMAYENLQKKLDKISENKYYIATVEGSITIYDIIKKLKEKKINKVTITPFMLVCGDHANNDMIGDEDDSWINLLKSEAIEVDVILKGLGEYTEFRDFFCKKI